MTTHRTLGVVAAAAGAAILVAAGGYAWAKTTKAELQAALNDQAIVGDWNYDDIRGAFRRARKEGRPVCVVFR